MFYILLNQKPDWISVGSYVGSSKGKLVDRSDGFFYVPLLSTVESLLSNKHIYNQVGIFRFYCMLVGGMKSLPF